jgi:hypothetical protein
MLGFFRKYQKIFFIFITVVVVISFCFFGTYSTVAQQEVSVDRAVGAGICGKPIMRKEMQALCRLIDSSTFDVALRDEVPNLLNDGVIEKEFLATGLGTLLLRPHFSDFKPDLDERVKKIHSFRPYEHPSAPGVGLESLWQRISPSFGERYRALKRRSDQATLESFFLMSDLYVEQTRMLPLSLTRQFLALQSEQQGAPVDPLLANASLSLFGFKSMEEWFGPRFVPLVAHFIMNAAQIAEERGYSLKLDEVRKDLLQNAYTGYRQLMGRGGDPKPEEVYQYYQAKIRSLGLDEMTALGAWKKVLLFRRLFEETAGSVLVDPLAYNQFRAFAQEGVKVTLYQVAEPLQFADFLSMLKFQLYLESIAPDPALVRKSTDLPVDLASLGLIEKRAPELIDWSLEISWKQISREEILRTLSLKEMRALQHTGPALLQEALERAPQRTEQLSLRAGGSFWKTLCLAEDAQLLGLLTRAALQGETPNEANEALFAYAPDAEHLYRIEVIRRVGEKRLLSYREALKEGALDRLLDRTLEKASADMRKKQGSSVAKEEVGKIAFADLLRAIERDYKAVWGVLPENMSLEFYSNARLLRAVIRERDALMEHRETRPISSLLGLPHLLTEETKVLSRSEPAPLSKKDLFARDIGSFSPVKVGERGQLAFCRIEGREQVEGSPLEDMQQGHSILGCDAKRDLMLQILTRMNGMHVHFTPEAP